MKVMTVLGTRPEIIRLSLISRLLDQECEHVIVHTGQNAQDELQEFYRELDLRAPDVQLNLLDHTFGAQVGEILTLVDRILRDTQPDRVVVLGDTTSGLAALAAARLGIPVLHLEAGNRCFERQMPEELNRRIIDTVSTLLLPYTHRSRDYLLQEGFAQDRIVVIGNPIVGVLRMHQTRIAEQRLPSPLKIKKFILATLHRAECVDNPARLITVLDALGAVATALTMPVWLSLHPRTMQRMEGLDVHPPSTVRLMRPPGFFEFVGLERDAALILTDSGTVQEEGCLLGTPVVTLRPTTERPETVECGANMIAGYESASIVRAAQHMIGQKRWDVPIDYDSTLAAEVAVAVILGHHPALVEGRLLPLS